MDECPVSIHVMPARSSQLPFRDSYSASTARADSVGVFEQLFDERISLCVWQRTPDIQLEDYVRQAAPSLPPARLERVSLRWGMSETVLSDFPEGPQKAHLIDELRGLVDLFSTLADTRTVGVRIVATDTAMCPQFHTDRVSLRLLCTWAGAGTEWVERRDVVSVPQAAGALRLTEMPMRVGAVLNQMQCFDIGVFKGELWPVPDGYGVLHRSPPPRASTERRVLVSLDAL